MAIWTRTESGPTLAKWRDVWQFPAVAISDTEILHQNSDGTFTQLLGTGFGFSGGVVGTITGLVHFRANGEVIEVMSDLNHSLAEAYNVNIEVVLLNGNDFITGHSGHNNINGWAGNDTILGNGGDDVLSGSDGFDAIYGGAGNDIISGGDDDDILVGDAGNDQINGGAGNDVISELYDVAFSGDDTINGGTGIDIIYAAAGNDIVTGGNFGSGLVDTANNYADLGTGNDTYNGASGTDVVVAGDGIDFVNGNDGDDALYGEAGNDVLSGGAGIDLLSGSTGNDNLDGGAGNDLLIGDAGNDVLFGDDGIDVLFGFANDDSLNGGPGNDVDALYGGAGNDQFRVGGQGYGTDYVWDFQGGVGLSDQIVAFAGTSISSQFTQSGNYYINFANGSHVVIVGWTSLAPDDFTFS